MSKAIPNTTYQQFPLESSKRVGARQRMYSTMSSPTEMVDLMRQRVREKESSAEAWESLWKDGITPWDLGGPTKVLIDELKSKSSFVPKTSLIPGCGSGHDVVSLARYLDEVADGQCMVVGLELSQTSLEAARSNAEGSLANDGPLKQTTIHLVEGNFFQNALTWKSVYVSDAASNASPPPLHKIEAFDFIFDYTFFCAISPHLRNQWGSRMVELMEPKTSKLLTLMFPYHPSIKKTTGHVTQGGPPYLVSLDSYRQVLETKGISMETKLPYESPMTTPQRSGQEVVGWWRRGSNSKL